MTIKLLSQPKDLYTTGWKCCLCKRDFTEANGKPVTCDECFDEQCKNPNVGYKNRVSRSKFPLKDPSQKRDISTNKK